MKQRIRVNFSETAKEVKADVTLELEGEDINQDEIIAQAESLFDKAKVVADAKTMKKMQGQR